MPSIADAEAVLLKHFSFEHFRAPQVPIITAVLSGTDVLALLPTGGGKSLCFQVPGLMRSGLTLVISPLIALMVDQVRQLQRNNIAAVCWHSQLSKIEVAEIEQQIKLRKIKFLYLSPEKIWHPAVQKLLQQCELSLIVIDEAHCISLWGHDFRPQYLKLRDWVAKLEQRPQIIALTATATPTVQQEIIEFLNLKNPVRVNQSSVRDNLAVQVLLRNSPTKKLISILTLLEHYPNQTAILYCSTRSVVEETWQILQKLLNREVYFYHGGLSKTARQFAQEKFLSSPTAILVATNAFGMGIDKPDIRLIIHTQIPSNLENYSQEIGRAGRDGKLAAAVLLVSKTDWQIQLELSANQPNHAYKMRYLKYYIETRRCRMSMLSEYFGEQSDNCGKCDVCCQQKTLHPTQKTWQLYGLLKQLKTPYLQTLKLISLVKPQNLEKLSLIPGMGTGMVQKWGQQILNQTHVLIE
jgi:ATP-dependent DNA helicase RecQ